MSYGRYKNIRNVSWQCLIEFKITALPVDLLHIAGSAGIRVIRNSEMNILTGGETGLCILDQSNQWNLIYNDKCTIGRRRCTIAHELGHIFLGHELIEGKYGKTFDTRKPKREAEADAFARGLLAPACVLWGLNLHKAEEIKHACIINKVIAKARADRMVLLYKHQKFLTDPLEKKVYEQFREFIKKNKTQNK